MASAVFPTSNRVFNKLSCVFFAALAIILPMNPYAKLQAALLPRRHEPAVIEQLIASVRDGVRSLAWRFAIFHRKGRDEAHDFESAGLVAVWKAIPDYQEGRGRSFSSFVLQRARWAMWQEAADMLGIVRLPGDEFQLRKGRLPRASRDRRDKKGSMFERMASAILPADVEYDLKKLRAAVDALPERPRQILVMELRRYMNGPEIAAVMGMKKQRVSQVRSSGIEMLADFLIHGIPIPKVRRRGKPKAKQPQRPKVGWTGQDRRASA